MITVLSIITTEKKEVGAKSKSVILNKQYYMKLYNFHIIIEGNVSVLPNIIIRSSNQEANIDVDFYLNLNFEPNVGFKVTYYSTVENKMVISYKSFGKPEELSVIVKNNDTNPITAYMIIEAEVGGAR